MCTVLLRAGVNTIAVNKYININIIVRSIDPVHLCSSPMTVLVVIVIAVVVLIEV